MEIKAVNYSFSLPWPQASLYAVSELFMHSDAIGLAFAAFHTWSQEPGYEAYQDYNFVHAVRINILGRTSGSILFCFHLTISILGFIRIPPGFIVPLKYLMAFTRQEMYLW